MLKVGTAVGRDKMVVIDPLPANCVVAAGSQNLGFKASYENDENLLIIKTRVLPKPMPCTPSMCTTIIGSALGRPRAS